MPDVLGFNKKLPSPVNSTVSPGIKVGVYLELNSTSYEFLSILAGTLGFLGLHDPIEELQTSALIKLILGGGDGRKKCYSTNHYMAHSTGEQRKVFLKR